MDSDTIWRNVDEQRGQRQSPGDDGLLHGLRDVLVRQRLAVLHREAAELRLAVLVVDEGGVRQEVLVGVGQLGALVSNAHGDGRDDARYPNG